MIPLVAGATSALLSALSAAAGAGTSVVLLVGMATWLCSMKSKTEKRTVCIQYHLY